MRRGGTDQATAEAAREFGLPKTGLAFARSLPQPLYLPLRALRS